MSKVVFLDPIDHVSGKLSKKSRVTYCYRHPGLSEKGEDRKYTQIRGKRSTPYTAAELARFDKFSAVAKAVAAVMKNPAALQTAQAEFAAQCPHAQRQGSRHLDENLIRICHGGHCPAI